MPKKKTGIWRYAGLRQGHRTFNGKQYRYHTIAKDMGHVKADTHYYKKRGYSVRVVRLKNNKYGKYAMYVRKR